MIGKQLIVDMLNFMNSTYSYVKPSKYIVNPTDGLPSSVTSMYVITNTSTGKSIQLLATTSGSYADDIQIIDSPAGTFYDCKKDPVVGQSNLILINDAINKYLSDSDAVKLSASFIGSSMKFVQQFYPMLYRSLLNLKLIPDDSIETLYVTYNKVIDKVELHYNSTFVLKGALAELLGNLANVPIKSVEDKLTDSDVTNFLNALGSFYFLHEVYHIIYRHVADNDESAFAIPHDIENYVEDSYINTRLLKVYNNNIIIRQLKANLGADDVSIQNGITSTYTITGKIDTYTKVKEKFSYNRLWLGYGSPDVLKQFIDQFGQDRSIAVTCQNLNTKDSYDQFSTVTKKLINSIFAEPTDTQAKSTSAGQGPDNSRNGQGGRPPQASNQMPTQKIPTPDPNKTQNGQGQGQGQGNQQSNQPDSPDAQNQGQSGNTTKSQSPTPDATSTNASGQSGTSSQGQSSQQSNSTSTNSTSTSNSSSGKSDSPNAGNSKGGGRWSSDYNDIPDSFDKTLSEVASEVAKELSNANNPNKDSSKDLNDTPSIDKDLQRVIKAKSGSTKVAKGWRLKLKSMIEDATGIKVTYNPDAPNPRIEGQLGRESTENTLGDIVFSFDISGSMSVSDFKAALDYVSDMMRMGVQFSRVGYAYWTDSSYAVAPRSVSPSQVYRQALSNCPNYRGGTYADKIAEPFISGKLRSCRPDLIIIFTDGQIYSWNLDEKTKAFFRKYRHKILWVLTPGSASSIEHYIKSFDSTANKRCVVMTDNSVAKNR